VIGHSTGRRSLSTVGGTHVCPPNWGDTRVSPQPWREIDAHGVNREKISDNVENNTVITTADSNYNTKT